MVESLASMTIEAAQDKISRHQRDTRYQPRCDQHMLFRVGKQEEPDVVISALNRRATGMPGSLRVYRDPNTGEVYGYAVFNTF
jgi:hypothetical protein